MSRLVLLQSVVFCLVLHTAERDPSAGERGHCTGQCAGSKGETHIYTYIGLQNIHSCCIVRVVRLLPF